MSNCIDRFYEKLPKGRCHPCIYAKAVVAQNEFVFLGCYHKPFKGKAVAEIKDCPKKGGGTGMSYTIGNHDDITTAILALDMFTKNWCMNCAETEKQGEPVFRCSECEFHGHDSMCAIKIFANNHDSDFDMSRFGCMSR